MNPVKKALDEIKFTIPAEVLRIAFQDQRNGWRSAPISLDEQITEQILRPRVLVDANLVGGKMANISLSGLTPIYVDPLYHVYEIPPDRTMNMTILSILSISPFAYPYTASIASQGFRAGASFQSSDVDSAAQRVSDSVSNIPVISSSQIELVGHNTISITGNLRGMGSYELRCIMENDENLNNISVRSYPAFAKLCILATKAFIYNKLVIRIDQAYLQNGQELGSIKSYIESLSDAEEMYQTQLRDVWRVVSVMNDRPYNRRLISLMVNPQV